MTSFDLSAPVSVADSLLADLQNTISHKAGSVGGSPRRVAYSPTRQQRSPSPVLPAYQPNVDPHQVRPPGVALGCPGIKTL